MLYVDDMMIAARNKTHIQKLKAQLKEEFDMKDLWEAKKDLRNRDQSRQKYMQTLAIPGELYFQDIEKIQHDWSKTGHYSFAVF